MIPDVSADVARVYTSVTAIAEQAAEIGQDSVTIQMSNFTIGMDTIRKNRVHLEIVAKLHKDGFAYPFIIDDALTFRFEE